MCVHHSVHLSMQLRSGGWNTRPPGKPLVVGLEWQPKLFVVDTQVAVVTADDSIRPHGLNFLRHYADITLVAAVVAEAIEAEAIVEMPEQDDMVLERDVGTSSATASAAAATAATTAAATAATLLRRRAPRRHTRGRHRRRLRARHHPRGRRRPRVPCSLDRVQQKPSLLRRHRARRGIRFRAPGRRR